MFISNKILLTTRTKKDSIVRTSSFNLDKSDGEAICNHFIDFVKEATGLCIKKTQVNITSHEVLYSVIASNEDGKEVVVANIFNELGQKYDPEQSPYEHDGIVSAEHIKTILLNLIASGHIPFSGHGPDTDKGIIIPSVTLFYCDDIANRLVYTCGNDPLLSKLVKNGNRINYSVLTKGRERFYLNLEENKNNQLKQIPAIDNKYDSDKLGPVGYFDEDGHQQIKPFDRILESDIKNTLLLEPEVIDALSTALRVNFIFSRLSTSIALNHDIVYYEKKPYFFGPMPELIEPNEHYGTVVDSNILNGTGSLSQVYEYTDAEVQECILDSMNCLLFFRHDYKEDIVIGDNTYLETDDSFLDDNFGYPVNIHKSVNEVVSIKSFSKAELGDFLFLLWDNVDSDDDSVEDICIAFYRDVKNNLYSVAKINVKTKGLASIDIFNSKERALHHTVSEYSKKTGFTAGHAKKLVESAAKYYKSGFIVKNTTATEFFDIK